MKSLKASFRPGNGGQVENKIYRSISEASNKLGIHRATINRSLNKNTWVKDNTYKFEWLENKPTIGSKQSVIVTYLIGEVEWDKRWFPSLTLASKYTGISRNRIRRASKNREAVDDGGYQKNLMKFQIVSESVEGWSTSLQEHIERYLRVQWEEFGRGKIPLVELEAKGYIYTSYYPKCSDLHNLEKEKKINCDGIIVTYPAK